MEFFSKKVHFKPIFERLGYSLESLKAVIIEFLYSYFTGGNGNDKLSGADITHKVSR